MAGSVSLPSWFAELDMASLSAPWLAVSELLLSGFSSVTELVVPGSVELCLARRASHCLRSPIAFGSDAGDTYHCVSELCRREGRITI